MATLSAERMSGGQANVGLAAPRGLGTLLASCWHKGWLPEPTLDPQALADHAERVEGGTLEEGPWREALGLLSSDLRHHASLNNLGRVITHGLISKILRQRVRARKLWHSRPEILATPIAPPVVILGHMRSGTTRLHRLLACDPQFTYTRLHETLDPVSSSRPRSIGSALAVRWLLNLCNPQLKAIHPISPLAPEEEFGLHAFSFHGAMFEAQWKVPGFARWCEERPLGDVYREFRQLLQTIRFRRKDPPQAIQLLKAPQFMQDLDEVLRTFPDARILFLTRRPEDVLASTASLVWNQQRVQSDTADPHWAGREWARKTELRQQRAEAALAVRPDVPVLRVEYADVDRNWQVQTGRIYDFLRLPLSRGVTARMARIASGSKHKGHHYRPEQFGLA